MTTAEDNSTLQLAVERPLLGQTPSPRMGELGNTLSRARRARAITLEDVERDTHVSRRYLQALENEDFTIFPAPVYARGFLRTYARYLGLNPDELLRVFPSAELTVDITPLPMVEKPPEQLINVNWLVAGLVAIFLLGAGLLLMRTGSGDPGVDPATLTQQQAALSQNVSTSAGGQVQAPPATTGDAPVQGKTIAPARPGEYPNFVGADLPSAMTVLRDNDMNYFIIQVYSDTVPKDIIISQSPAAGGKASSDSAVYLISSRGPASASANP
jgi:transcriptional regulator with XRE-family HTH domain